MSWRVPLSEINIDEREISAVTDTMRSGWITMGQKVQSFEEAFRDTLGCRHAIAVCNGTAGLHLAYLAAGVAAGTKVICPSLTFVATVNAVLYVGATPVMADIHSDDDLTLDPEEVENRIDEQTSAIVPMHYGGAGADMEALCSIAQRYNLVLVEDACHAPAGRINGRSLGCFGDIGVFSFYGNKNLTTGEGGMLVTDSDAIAERLRLLRSHGMTRLSWVRYRENTALMYDVVDLGYNFRMDDIRAAMGLVQLEKLARNNEVRRQRQIQYAELLAAMAEVHVPAFLLREGSVPHLMVVLVSPKLAKSRDAISRDMAEDGIQTSLHYPPAHQFSHLRERLGECVLPRTESVASRLISLPLYARMSDDDVRLVVEALKKALTRVAH